MFSVRVVLRYKAMLSLRQSKARSEEFLTSLVPSLASSSGPIETSFGTHLIWVESCNEPQNTWKMLFDDVVKGIKGDGDDKA